MESELAPLQDKIKLLEVDGAEAEGRRQTIFVRSTSNLRQLFLDHFLLPGSTG
jgi:hypothetical protein